MVEGEHRYITACPMHMENTKDIGTYQTLIEANSTQCRSCIV